MALQWRVENGKTVGHIDGASNPAFIITGEEPGIVEVRITGAEHLSGEYEGDAGVIQDKCAEMLTEHNIPLEGTQTSD